MSLSDALQNGPPPTGMRGPRCAISKLFSQLPNDDEREALKALILNEDWTLKDVIRAIEAEYPNLYSPDYSTYQRHRRKVCKCGLMQ